MPIAKPDATVPVVETPLELMGQVRTATGSVVILDMGMLNLWSHDRTPVFPEGLASPEVTARANDAVDLRIEGPDAERAGLVFDRQWHPLFVYDVPREGLARVRGQFEALVREHNLMARVVELPGRVSHRARVDVALARGGGAGEISFHGMWASAIAGVPAGRVMAVYGQGYAEGPDAGRWRQVFLECNPGARVVRSEFVGHVAVDMARMIIADPDALGMWQHEMPLDDQADFLFWGKDAQEMARLIGASVIPEDSGKRREYGWLNLPIDEAVKKGRSVEFLKLEKQLKMAVDFRPHSHHYSMMGQVRNAATASGTLEIGDFTACGFATSWGDGMYRVFRDFSEDGQLARVRIDLGGPYMVERQRRFEEWHMGLFAQMAFVSNRVAKDEEPVRWLYREPARADREQDSGWRIFAGDESVEYNDDANNVSLMPLRDLIVKDGALEAIFRMPAPVAFERNAAGEQFRRVDPPLEK